MLLSLDHLITVKDVLQREHFKDAKVIAGKHGLDRKVRWVHILETNDFDTFIHGEELILTTGVGIQLGLSSQVGFLKKLIQLNVSCLCIELGDYFKWIPREFIDIANEHHFPIIVFEHTVKFIDITQDLHALIVNRHYEMIQNLEKISREFIQLTLSSDGIFKILQALYKVMHTKILFIPTDGNMYCYPHMNKQERAHILESYQKKNSRKRNSSVVTLNKEEFLIEAVSGLGKVWGQLLLKMNQDIPREFAKLVLDRASLAVAQLLLRKRTIEERKLHTEEVFISELLNKGRLSDVGYESLRKVKRDEWSYRVVGLQLTSDTGKELTDEERDSIRLQQGMMIRSLFKQCNFTPLMTKTDQEIAVIALFSPKDGKEKEPFLQVIDQIEKLQKNELFNSKIYIGIGGLYEDLIDAHKSFYEARQVIQLKKFKNEVLFYEDLGVYRLLLPFENDAKLERFVMDYLGPIIQYDKEKGSELLTTLKVYLDDDGSKKEAAERLFIVRQTLYHRLEKIKQLLGDDFTNAEKRLSLELALRAYELLTASKNKKMAVF